MACCDKGSTSSGSPRGQAFIRLRSPEEKYLVEKTGLLSTGTSHWLFILPKTFSPISINLHSPACTPTPMTNPTQVLASALPLQHPSSTAPISPVQGHPSTVPLYWVLVSPTGLLTPRSYGPFPQLPCLPIMSSRTGPMYPAPVTNVIQQLLLFSSWTQHTYTVPMETVLLDNVTLFPLIITSTFCGNSWLRGQGSWCELTKKS